MAESCAICGCTLHREGQYAEPTPHGRSHATKHHFVAERFFGRSNNRRRTKRAPIFSACPWDLERKTAVFCYDCHEELLHNPVLLPEDIAKFSELVRLRQLSETKKPNGRALLAGRIRLLHEALSTGIATLLQKERHLSANPTVERDARKSGARPSP